MILTSFTGLSQVAALPGARVSAGETGIGRGRDEDWTPLSLRASAIDMTSGSYLSHGAIVAREYNIPSVVNFPGILTDLRQGALLVMDDEAASSAKR